MKYPTAAAAVLLLACLLVASGTASAQGLAESFNGGRPIRNNGNVFQAKLGGQSGANAANFGSSGRGPNAQFTIVVDVAAQTAQYSFTINNVNGYTASHIHVGAAGVNGAVVVALLPGIVGTNINATAPTIAPTNICTLTITGTITATTLIQNPGMTFTFNDFVNGLRTSGLYVNIHTQAQPDGLIRAQIIPTRSRRSFDFTCRNTIIRGL